MTHLNLNIELPQNLVLDALKRIDNQEESIGLSEYITQLLEKDVEKETLPEADLLGLALQAVSGMRKPGDQFTLNELLANHWEDVKSPRSFGRKFKKGMEHLDLAIPVGKRTDNKIIYERTNNKGEKATQYLLADELVRSRLHKEIFGG